MTAGCNNPHPDPEKTTPPVVQVSSGSVMDVFREAESPLELIEYGIISTQDGSFKRATVKPGPTPSFVWGEEKLKLEAETRAYSSWDLKDFGCERLKTPSAGMDPSEALSCSLIFRDEAAKSDTPVPVYNGSVTVSALGLTKPVYEGHWQYVQVQQWGTDPRNDNRLGWVILTDPSKKIAEAHALRQDERGSPLPIKDTQAVPLNYEYAQGVRAKVIDALTRAEKAVSQ